MPDSTSSSLALRALLKTAIARAGLGQVVRSTTGLSQAAVALHAAALAAERPRVLVVPTDRDVEQVTADARFFLVSVLGLTAATSVDAVLPCPSPEVDPYRGLAPHLDVASARARALHAMASGAARLVIVSARALVPKLSTPAALRETGLSFAPGDEIAPQHLADRLVAAGFTREDPVDQHGEFCVRGGIVDLYPASEDQPGRPVAALPERRWRA